MSGFKLVADGDVKMLIGPEGAPAFRLVDDKHGTRFLDAQGFCLVVTKGGHLIHVPASKPKLKDGQKLAGASDIDASYAAAQAVAGNG